MNLDFDAIQRMAVSQFWQLTVVVCAVGLLTWLFCRRRPHLAYVLWLVVLVKAVTPPLWSSPTGVFSWADVRVARSDSMPTSEPGGSGLCPDMGEGASGSLPAAVEFDETRADEPGGVGVSPVHGPDAHATLTPAGTLGWGELLGLAWLFGAAALGGLLVGRWSYYSVLLRHNSVDTPDDVLRLVDELSERLGVRRGVHVLVTTRPFGPAVCGLWRPTLILPQALVEGGGEEEGEGEGEKGDIQLFPSRGDVLPSFPGKSRMSPFSPTEHMRRIIAHELIHIRRGDHLVGVLQLLTQVVWWFHPLVWWTNRRICVQREHCCDEQVVASLRCDPGVYAQSLLDTLKLRRQLRPALLPGVDAPEVTRKRLENLMDPRKVFHGRAPRVCWAALVVGILLLVPGAGFTLAEKGPEPAGVTTLADPDEAAVAQVVESFLAAATKGRIDEAVQKLSRHRANERGEIREMGAMLAPQKVMLDRVAVRDDKAMVLTSKIRQSARREGRLLFELVKTGELWLIHEIDLEKGADRVDAFVGKTTRPANPEKPPIAATAAAIDVPFEAEVTQFVASFLAAAAKGEVRKAIGMMDMRGEHRKDIEELGKILAGQSVEVDRVAVKGDKAKARTSAMKDDRGRLGFLQFDLVRKDRLWFITDIDFESTTKEFDAFADGANERPAATPVEEPANLLLNAGFEEGDGSPSGWSQGAAVDGVEYVWDRDNGFKSKSSLAFNKTVDRYFPIAQWEQAIDHKGRGHTLQVQAKVKAENVGKATIDVIFLDENGQWISHKWAAYIGAKGPNDRPANHDWKTYSGRVRIPRNTKRITIGLQMYGPGRVWFDDVRAVYVDAASRAAASDSPASDGSEAAATKQDTASTTTSGDFTGPQLIQLGWTYWTKGQFDKALPKFEQAVKLVPENPDAWNGLGWANFQLGKWTPAENAFKHTLKLMPEAGGSLNGLGQLYLLEKKYDEAEKYLLKAAAPPGASGPWFGLAKLYLLQGKFAEAEKWAQKIVDSQKREAGASGDGDLLLKAAKEKRLDEDLRTLIEPGPVKVRP